MWGHVHQVQLAGIFHCIAEIMWEALIASVGRVANPPDSRDTQVPVLARVVEQVRVHEQHLAAVGEVFPYVVAILLWRVFPRCAEVGMIAVVDVHLAGRSAAPAGGDWGNGAIGRYPVR